MNLRKIALHVLASAALLSTGVMTDPPAVEDVGPAATGCPMIENPLVVCGRPIALH